MQSFSYMETLGDLFPFFQTLKRSKNVRKGTKYTFSINLVNCILLNELLNICVYCMDIFSCEGFRVFVIKIFYMIIIIPFVRVLTKNWF